MKKQKQTKWTEYGNRFSVAGVQYSDYQRVLSKMKLGEQVRFIGEPKNVFDNKAIRIEYKGVKIGYVPAASAIQLGLWSEHGAKSIVVGVVTAINKNNPSWQLFTIQVLVKRIQKSLTRNQGEVEFAKMRAELSYQ